jgi:CubicO group peptidase (beta-lactamase class C family)
VWVLPRASATDHPCEARLTGRCDARFQAVGEVLRENAATRGEWGAAVAVTVEGRTVVDLQVGWADAARTQAWRGDTVVNVYSVGKALAAICALRLVARGALDLDAPVARYWPGFVAETATVRDVLSHRAGLAAIAEPLPDDALYDPAALADAIARQEPWWTPGTAHGYHVHTFGILLAELVRRASGGTTIGALLADEVAAPLEADVQFGCRPDDRARRAEYLIGGTADPPVLPTLRPGARLRPAAYLNPPGASGVGTVNTEAWMDAELPSANAHASARGIARVYAGLLDATLLDADTLAAATAPASDGDDLVLERPSRFGLGFQLTQPERRLGPNPRAFGHFGAGGALGFADPDAGVAFGYVMNNGGSGWQNPRNRALIDAVYAALG